MLRRDLLLGIALLALVLGGLYIYTGTWPPAVIVESGSMMHADSEVTYGRIGTIDPGDLVLVKHVKGPEDVGTLVEGSRGSYGKPGDVLIYHPGGDAAATPIIHRALAYIEVRPGPLYWVRWSDEAPCEGGASKARDEGHSWCVYAGNGVLVPSASLGVPGPGGSLQPYRPQATGFVTKGDHNAYIDPVGPISHDAQGRPSPVLAGWIEGKARGELPWLGLVKLALAGKPNQPDPPADWTKVGSAYAPRDLWVMLAVSLGLLVGAPLGWDAWRALQRRRRSREPVPSQGAKPQERGPPPGT